MHFEAEKPVIIKKESREIPIKNPNSNDSEVIEKLKELFDVEEYKFN
jgi:hypothetical protein